MSELQKVRIQLYDGNDKLIGDVDVMTSADSVTFADGETFQQKLEAGKLAGPAGATGPKGATGATGASATIAVGTVTTGVEGSSATVNNVGSSNAAILDFTIPRGKSGTQGPKGDTGAAGQRGSQAYAGTGITGTSTTAAIFSGSGISTALVNDIYFNTSTGNFYQCTVSGAASTAKWVYKGSFKGPKGDTGATGPKGATGLQGIKGDPGDTVRVGTDYATSQQRKLFFKVVE